MKKLNIGILSVSNHFIKRIILPLQNSSNCRIYAIASRNAEKATQAAKEFNIPVVNNSYDELIENENVDIIYNPLPNHLHHEWTIKSLKKGKPVLCEKPFSMNQQEAQEMVETSITTGTPLMEAFMYKFHPLWIHVKNLIRTNQIGQITYIHTAFSYNNPSQNNIRNIKEFGGGALMDIGCYAISVPRFLLDSEPSRVISLVSPHPQFETDMHTSAIMDFGTARASFHVSTLSEPFQKVDIVGTAGSITIHIPFNTYVDTPSKITINSGQGSREVQFAVCDSYGLMFESFADSIIKKQPMPITLLDSINNMKVLDAIVASGKTSNWETIA